jgi:hypothetical protein
MKTNKIRLFRKPLLVAATVGIASLSTLGLAWSSHISSQINSWRQYLASYDFVQEFETYTDFLEQGSSQTLYATLHANQEFCIVGVGDDDVHDLDLELFDERGRLVNEDRARDGDAVVSVKPVRTGEYRIRVTLSSCRYYICEYGIAVFSKS